MSLPRDIIASVIAPLIPFEDRAGLNLSVKEWHDTMNQAHIELIKDELQIKPTSLLYKRLALFISSLNSYLLEHKSFNCFRINIDKIKRTDICWGEDYALPDLNEKINEFYKHSYLLYVSITKSVSDHYLIILQDKPDNAVAITSITFLKSEDFPVMLLAMIKFSDLRITGISLGKDKQKHLKKLFDKLRLTSSF